MFRNKTQLKPHAMLLHKSETEQNLLAAFAGESASRMQYQLYAEAAKKDGYISIQRIFEETASHELSHAKSFFKHLETSPMQLQASYAHSPVADTKNNLLHALNQEHSQAHSQYPHYMDTAQSEGFNKIASLFKVIAEVEMQHHKRFLRLFHLLDSNTFYKRDSPVEWKCLKCGYVHWGKKAFEHCPACSHPKAYFEAIESFY